MNRIIRKLTYGWKFKKYPLGAADPAAVRPDFDDADWETVRVPHDWAITGTFEPDNDASELSVQQDGIVKAIPHLGRTGALPIVGTGVYRLALDIPEEARGHAVTLEFDGVMWESEVYVNGEKLAFHHFGYTSFEVDITRALVFGGENLIAVTASVLPACSRWYPGAGIYRNVRLVEKDAAHLNYNGVWLRQLDADNGIFELSAAYTGPDTVQLRAEIAAPDGSVAAEVRTGVTDGELSAIFRIDRPLRWDVDAPNLYTARAQLTDGDGNALDDTRIRFGVRTFAFTPDGGFFLNGRPLKLQGVCGHHDLGSLGAAVSIPALRRQLRLLRQMGVNSIRTSHNPPAPELLDLCDEMGFTVMDELFDEWRRPKVKNGYFRYFDEHAEADAVSVIHRDRNHPSVILWSIGNEIYEQHDPEGWKIAKRLTAVCHREDPTRLTTAGMDGYPDALEKHMAFYVDVVGLNYKPHYYRQVHEKYPSLCIYGSETASCVSTRGVYHLPAESDIPCKKQADLTVSAYELAAPGWAYTPEREWAAQDSLPYVAGEYVWTGFDYLGEPTPYYSEWPSRSSYFGAIDLAGLPKNRFYGYRAQWTSEPVLHVFPHWIWEGHEGEIVPVHVYTNYPEAELFINGKSFGRRLLGDPAKSAAERYRLVWNDAVYEPGELRVAAYRDGKAAGEAVVRTAGAPDRIVLTADRTELAADGDDLVYITAAVVDRAGTVCPHSDARITFRAEGAGELLTTDNGDQRETESFARPDKRCLAGYCVACVRTLRGVSGKLTVRADAEGLTGASLDVTVI